MYINNNQFNNFAILIFINILSDRSAMLILAIQLQTYIYDAENDVSKVPSSLSSARMLFKVER